LVLLLIVNIALAPFSTFFLIVLGLQILFYLSAYIGYVLEDKKLKVKIFFVPYYFYIMNYAVFMGFGRYIKKSQSVNWERAKRG
jgi:hypothetical protein